MDGVELRHRIGFCFSVVFGSPFALADVDDEEARVESAFLHFWEVYLPLPTDAGIDFGGCEVRRNIVVGVDGDDARMNRLGLGDDLILGQFFDCLTCSGGGILGTTSTSDNDWDKDQKKSFLEHGVLLFEGVADSKAGVATNASWASGASGGDLRKHAKTSKL